MDKRFSGVVIALAIAATTMSAAAQGSNTSRLTLTRDGAPAANVQVQVKPLNGASRAVGSTGPTGDLEFALSLINKDSRYQVVVVDCGNGEHLVIYVEAGSELPERENCRTSILGVIRVRAGSAVMADLTGGTLSTTSGQSFIGSTRGKAILGGAAVVIGGSALLAGGNDSNSGTNNPNNQTPTFNPSGTYQLTITVLSDPGENHEFVRLPGNTQIVLQITGSAAQITTQANSNLPQMSGTHAAGQITLEGRGTVVVHQNVPYQLVAAIEMSGSNQGQMSGQVTVGSDRQLRGGHAIVYRVVGRKQ